jgi:hypothetical protein
MPNRPYNPKQGWLLPYAIRPLPPERAAAVAEIELALQDQSASEPATAEQDPA